MPEELPDGVFALIEVHVEGGIKVNLRKGMSTKDFAQMLRLIADAYELDMIERIE